MQLLGNRRNACLRDETSENRARTVLIVEDERIFALDLRDTLRSLGYLVVGIASSFEGAMKIAEEHSPDIALMDIRIAGTRDGIDAARELQARRDCAVVFLTASTDDATLRRALEATPDGFLPKPLSLPHLVTTLEVALRKRESERALRAAHQEDRRHFEIRSSELEMMAAKLEARAHRDALTGLCNRFQFDQSFPEHLRLAGVEAMSCGLILFDIDWFKAVNDTYGHAGGDAVLRELGEFLRQQLRPVDVACRLGGEEFAVIAPGSTLADAVKLAERLRTGIADLKISISPHSAQVSASFGVCAYPEHGATTELLFHAADASLYAAKAAGRNRVCVATF
jgi:diguanylate cyclase (GGDEF)-like protein